MASKTRNSSIELLRLLCIVGIIFMHTIAYGGDELAIYNRYLLIVVNCFTNIGVTCFMLISGYFGVKLQPEKLIKLDLMIILYSILHVVIKLLLGVEVGVMSVVSAIFPVLSNQYWYVTAYFIIVIFSNYINQIPEKLSKSGFENLLFGLIFLFAIVPTFLHFDILGSEGKNVVYMTTIYLIGRYIQKYDSKSYKKSRLAILLMLTLVVTLILETALFVVTGKYSIFYRDCSVFTLISSILVFTIFRNAYFENKLINKLAGCVLAIYVFSFGFQRLIHVLIPLENWAFSPFLFPMICVFTPCVVVGCMLIELVRQKIFGEIENKLVNRIATRLEKLLEFGKGKGFQFTDRIINYIIRK